MSVISDGLAAGVRTWLITGEQSWLVDRAVDELIAWGKQRCGPPQFNLQVSHGSDTGLVSAFTAARTLPMMSELRVIVVKQLEVADEAFFAGLVAYCAAPASSTLLVVAGEGFPAVRKGGSNWSVRVQNALKAHGKVLKFTAKDFPPTMFVREQARNLGKDLGAQEAALLVELMGGDLGTLAREVEKLAAYVGDEPKIGTAAIHEATSLVAEAVLWDLSTGIASRNPELAIRALHRLLDDGEAPHKLLAVVNSQLRTMLQVVEMAAQKRSEWDIREAVKLPGDRVSAILRAISQGAPSPVGVLERVARANRAMNSHKAGDRAVFEALVVELCRPRPA